ncbi:hypothetical protein BH23BAC3_BH23BAC3_26430 [soil metagenome]
MIQRIIIFCLIAVSGVLVLTSRAFCQHSLGARSAASGQTGVAVPGDPWSVFSNISFIPTDESYVSFYGFRYAGISEITDAAASATLPLGNGAFGTGVHRYGFHLFSETRFRAGYKQQWEQFHAGVVLNYTHVQQGGGYGSAGALGADIGIGAQIVEPLWLGARATNINQPSFAETDEELPRELAAGISYFPSPATLITAEVVKDVRFPLSFRAGIDAELIKGLHARAGISSNPETYSAGFGYKTARWQINFAVQQHMVLGLSPALDIGISL